MKIGRFIYWLEEQKNEATHNFQDCLLLLLLLLLFFVIFSLENWRVKLNIAEATTRLRNRNCCCMQMPRCLTLQSLISQFVIFSFPVPCLSRNSMEMWIIKCFPTAKPTNFSRPPKFHCERFIAFYLYSSLMTWGFRFGLPILFLVIYLISLKLFQKKNHNINYYISWIY